MYVIFHPLTILKLVLLHMFIFITYTQRILCNILSMLNRYFDILFCALHIYYSYYGNNKHLDENESRFHPLMLIIVCYRFYLYSN